MSLQIRVRSLLVIFVLMSVSVYSQVASQVKGVVQNDNDEPLAGVSVIVRNTKNNFSVGTTTDSSGIFTFSRLPVGGPYSFSFTSVGYESQNLGGYNTQENTLLSLVVKLKQLSSSLEQVVVVGYGAQKRKDLTGAISSLKSTEIKDLAVTRIEQSLLGKIAGVQVKPVSGQPGAPPQIRIRGIGSISAGASPLYVVDGFPTGSIETLNPNDIESLDILKDASATAIYGSRGSNGVIIINTKRGRAGKTNISFDTYYGWQKVSKKPEMMDAKEQAQYFYDGIKNRNIDEGRSVTGPAGTWTRPVPAIITDVIEGRNTYDENALDAVLVTAPQQQYQLSANGVN
jgi:TonB-dependent SusC/RagA subfamily outer membrane receptor